MELKGSETEKNLYKTFAGESRARNKYTFYAEKAQSEGYRYVAEIFTNTANQEMAHGREAFARYLKKCKSTEMNLEDAINGELEENKFIYKEFEEMAIEEGFEEIAKFYKELREVEEEHCQNFSKLLKKLREDKLYKESHNNMWQCMNCGYIYEGEGAPRTCPLCKYPREYFKPYCKNI